MGETHSPIPGLTQKKEVIILGGLLMLCWSGLRFSDLRRSQLSTWQLDHVSLMGLTWKAKTCNTATPLGIILSGLLTVYVDAELIDFALPVFQQQDVPVCQSI